MINILSKEKWSTRLNFKMTLLFAIQTHISAFTAFASTPPNFLKEQEINKSRLALQGH